MTTMVSPIVVMVVLAILRFAFCSCINFNSALNLKVNVNSQTCNNTAQYSACSSNSACGCLSYSFSNTMGVCGLLTQSCSEFVACQSPNDACEQFGYICVRHPRCNSNPLCYPPSMFDQSVCPPMAVMTSTRPSIIVSNYSSVLDSNDGRYIRPGSLSSGSFRYEAIQIIVDTTGTYSLASMSSLDTLGYLYNDTFYPLSPSVNLIQQDNDNGGNNQFKLAAFLQAGVPYTLVLSTQSTGYTGPFKIVASGPGDVQFFTLNPMETTTMTSMTTQTSSRTSNYSNVLTVNSQNYTRHGGSGSFYYQAIEVRVATTGTYTFSTSSTISDTYGYLYQGNFYPFYPQYNIIAQDDDSAGNRQFQLTAILRSDITYILIFTTLSPDIIGSFNIVASGSDDIFLKPVYINTLAFQ